MCVGGQWESPADEQDPSGQVQSFQAIATSFLSLLEGSQKAS